MDTIFNKLAAVLAALIGLMAVFAGGRVLLGSLPDYYLIAWLPVYNFVLGIVSASIAAMLIWKNNRFAMPAAIGVFGLHAVVMLILQTAYRQVVAIDSVVATLVRLVVWAIILALLFFAAKKEIQYKHNGGLK
ncbi:MAG: hypothetical protein JXA13_08160 [Anaerolineales bacterium]|nr:hypothetical protein [Anaerolineales bacterium]